MEFKVKTFAQLDTSELYALLHLRSAVFVVEQECVYQDVDYKDGKAIHVMGYEADTLVAYSRLFAPGDYLEKASIGRVTVHPIYRGLAYGHKLMHYSVSTLIRFFGPMDIAISAQSHLVPFYEQHGFVPEGSDYLEDGIPHRAMLRKI